MADYYLTLGDELPVISATLTDPDGAAVNLTGCTITLKAKHRETGTAYSFACTIISAAAGTVKYTWVSGNLTLVGMYDLRFDVVTSGGTSFSCPNYRYLTMQVQGNLS